MPVKILSSLSGLTNKGSFRSLGVDGYVTKLKTEDLASEITSVLKKSSSSLSFKKSFRKIQGRLAIIFFARTALLIRHKIEQEKIFGFALNYQPEKIHEVTMHGDA